MGTVSFGNLDQDFDITANYVPYTGSSGVTKSGNTFQFYSSTSNFIQFFSDGNDFTYDDTNDPQGGTITNVILDLDSDDANTPELVITNLTAAFNDLRNLDKGYFTETQQNDRIWIAVLGGADTIDFGTAAFAKNLKIEFAGDGRNAPDGFALHGAADTMKGSVGKFGTMYGDYVDVASTAAAFGGNDKLTLNRTGTAVGDAGVIGGSLRGGDDTIVLATNAIGADAYGDAREVERGGTVIGGNDTITVLDSPTLSGEASLIVGDVYDVKGFLIGGDDTITDGASNSFLCGDAYLVGGVAFYLQGGNDTIHGGGGNDSICGDSAYDYSDVKGGNDKLYGDAGNDDLEGNGGDDLLDGGAGVDQLYGGTGNDTYVVDDAKDAVAEAADEGTDVVQASVTYRLASGVEVEALKTTSTAGTAAIALYGNEFAQTLYGNAGSTTLSGGGGSDTLYGYAGNDLIYGGAGNDKLVGGAGNDAFFFDTALSTTNIDTISDFGTASGNNDTLRLDNSVFKVLTKEGALDAAAFVANTDGAAKTSAQHVVYETDTGKLFYDADGSGKGAAVQFAVLAGHPTLTAGDFLVV